MNLCKCHHIPPEGVFIKKNAYYWERNIDGIMVLDKNNNKIAFNDITYLWCFTKISLK